MFDLQHSQTGSAWHEWKGKTLCLWGALVHCGLIDSSHNVLLVIFYLEDVIDIRWLDEIEYKIFRWKKMGTYSEKFQSQTPDCIWLFLHTNISSCFWTWCDSWFTVCMCMSEREHLNACEPEWVCVCLRGYFYWVTWTRIRRTGSRVNLYLYKSSVKASI